MTNTMIVTDEVLELLKEIKRLRDHKDDIIKMEKHLTQRLYNIVNEHEELIRVDEFGVSSTIATWKYAKDTERFDAKSFKDSNPELYLEYVKISPGARTLRISK